MATKFQIKRTSVSGRTPNTTNAANSSYIAAGELAVNLTDKKLYSSNGTQYFEIGAFKVELVNTTSNVSTYTQISTLQFDEDSGFDVTNPSAGIAKIAMNSTFKYWQVDGVQKLTATGLDTVNFIGGNNIIITANGANTPQSIAFTTSLTPTYNSVTFGNSTVNTTINSTAISVTQIVANGSTGTSGQILSSNGTGLAWINNTSSEPSVINNTFTANGSNTQFTLSASSNTLNTFVSLNGVTQRPTTDYTVSGTTLTFATAPALNDKISTTIIDIPNLYEVEFIQDRFTGNGSNTQFTLSAATTGNTYSFVSINGVTQVPTTNFSISGTTITFTTAPVLNDLVEVISVIPISDFDATAYVANGTATSFGIPHESSTGSTFAFLNGVSQTQFADFYVSGNTVVFVTPPSNNDVVLIRSFHKPLSASGSNTSVQFNKSGVLSGSAGFTFNPTTNNVAIGNTLTVPNFILSASNPPANSTATGTTGTIAWDSSYLYVATGTNTWKKTPITTDGSGGGGGGGSANTAGSNTEIQFNDSSVLGANNKFTFNKDTTTLAIGSNVTVNTSTIFIGNSTVNTTITAGNVHLQGTQLTVGNVVITGSQITVGNSTVNTVIGANSFGVGMLRDSFTGNGSNTQFTLSSTPTDENHTLVFVDRVIQRDSDYNIAAAVLTFTSAPDSGSDIDVYVARAGVSASPSVGYSVTRNEFTGNGSNTDFSLSAAPQSEAHVLVFVDGMIQRDSDFTISGSTLTFAVAPDNASEIQTFVYQSAVALAGGSDTNIIFNDSTAANGSAGFTFNKTTNNVTISNTLVVGNSTVNTSAMFIGNSTVNTVVNSSSVSVVKIIANTSAGSNGQVLTSNGAGVYWANAASTSKYSNQYLLTGTTTNATETEIFIDGGATRIPVAVDKTVYYTIDCVCRRTDSTGDHAAFFLKGVATNASGTTTDVGSIYEVIVTRSDANFAVDARANNASDSVNIFVTGATGKTVSWSCVVTTMEV